MDVETTAVIAEAVSPLPVSEIRLATLCGHADPRVRRNLACRSELSTSATSRLATDADSITRELVAAHQMLTADVEVALASDSAWNVRREVAVRTQASELVDALAADAHPDVRAAIAERGDLNIGLRETLAVDDDDGVRSALASVVGLNREIQVLLASDGSECVRRSLAGRDQLDSDVLERLLGDSSENVRAMIARRPSLATPVLLRLAADQERTVRLAVASRQGDLEPEVVDALVHTDVDLLVYRQGLPDEVFDKIARSADRFVRTRIAAHAELPDRIVEALAQDESGSVRRAVARRPSLSLDVLRRLTTDEDTKVRRVVAKRDFLPEEIRRLL